MGSLKRENWFPGSCRREASVHSEEKKSDFVEPSFQAYFSEYVNAFETYR